MIESAPAPSRRVSYPLPLSRPVATWLLLAGIGLVFVAQTLAGGSTDTAVLIQFGAKVNPLIAAGEYWRLFTSMFLHIGAMHLLVNGYALFAIGTELERLLGTGRFVAIYVLSGLLGGLVSYAFSPHLAAGASGAIFGLIGALAAFFGLHRQRLGAWGQRRMANVLILIAINLVLGFTQPGIDNWAHMGGLLAGLGLGWALAPRYAVDFSGQRLVDQNRLQRYWPALVLAAVLLVLGTAAATLVQRDAVGGHLFRAQRAIEEEDWEQAVAELNMALARDPSSPDASLYFYLGLAHNNLQEPDLAARAYESALALEPDEATIHWNLALTYLELERLVEARDHFEIYLQLDPEGKAEAQPYLDELRELVP